MRTRQLRTSYIGKLGMLFVAFFVLSFCFPYDFLPRIGYSLNATFVQVNQLWADGLGLPGKPILVLESDTTGLYLHLLTLSILAAVGACLWQIRQANHRLAWTWFYTGTAYYVALTLLIYGMDKVMGDQFPFPTASLIHTKLGHLSPDILYWSSMGTSPVYSTFAGIIELIPAVLLLFRPTRWIGGLMALGVMVNVVMINIGFDISVKVYSVFLTGLCLVVVAPGMKAFGQFVQGKAVQMDLPRLSMGQGRWQREGYVLMKALVVTLICVEGGMEYVNRDGSNEPIKDGLLSGSYSIVDYSIRHSGCGTWFAENDLVAFHIHPDGFLMLEYAGKAPQVFTILAQPYDTFLIIEHPVTKRPVPIHFLTEENFIELSGHLNGDQEYWIAGYKFGENHVQLEQATPNWTIEQTVRASQK